MSVADALAYNGFPVPVGTLLPFAGNVSTKTVPYTYLVCDGTLLLKTDYPLLYDCIGVIYGGNATQFALPDLIGKVVQGSATNTDADVAPVTTGTIDLEFTLTEANMPNITNFAPTTFPVTTNGQIFGSSGVLGTHAYNQIGGGSGGEIAILYVASGDTTVNCSYTPNTANISYTGTATPVDVPLNITASPTGYNMTYLIKAFYN